MKKNWVLILSILLFLGVVALLLNLSVAKNDNHFIYALDDGYIHMTIARNLATNGSWGISPGDFCSASSSLLWTLLLAAFYALGISSVAIPFLLNALFAILLIWVLYSQIMPLRENISPAWQLAGLLSMIFICPLAPLVFVGMEHIFHILVSVLFVMVASKVISETGKRSPEWPAMLMLGAMLPAIRYEGLFLVFLVSGMLLLRRRVVKSLALGFFSFLPIAVFGFIASKLGGSFLPNSLLLKGNIPELKSLSSLFLAFGGRAILTLIREPHVMILVALASILFILRNKQKRLWEENQIFLVLSVFTVLFHLQFAKTGWFFRYEAYLVVLLILGILKSLSVFLRENSLSLLKDGNLPKYGAIALLVLVVLAPLMYRAGLSHIQTVPATNNIYAKQYQMVRFVQDFYPRDEIVINDLGALSYYTDAKLFDLWGLGSHDIVRVKRSQKLSAVEVSRLLESGDYMIAMIYDSWFPRDVHELWTKVGEWTVQDVVCEICHTISFYALSKSHAPVLAERLKLFSTRLPQGVQSDILIELVDPEEKERKFLP